MYLFDVITLINFIIDRRRIALFFHCDPARRFAAYDFPAFEITIFSYGVLSLCSDRTITLKIRANL